MQNRQIADSLGINSAVNAEPLPNDGRGVCTPRRSNLDKTGMRFVKKGCTVERQGFRYRVVRVRCGVAYVETLIHRITDCYPVSSLRVIA